MKKQEKIYCSLDIETSGFDPLVNEILEVGFAFFVIKKSDDQTVGSTIEILEKWTQVFKPSKPVSPQILGLTGISQEELEKAPLFSEYKDFLQDKLGSAVIVGHNIVFDTKFLEGLGIKFSGGLIDTLDLVQWVMPTHHSYNLENLMHNFGIAHKEAHRALADALATVSLLEALLKLFSSYPAILKEEILKVVKPYSILWKDFLVENFASDFKVNKKNNSLKYENQNSFKFASEKIFNFSFGTNFEEVATSGFSKKAKKSLLVLPKFQNALEIYQKKFVDGILVLPEDKFNPELFNKFKEQKKLNIDEIKFILKILVWLHTNWQTETILDLNLSFFGGQFRELITGGEIFDNNNLQVVCCDHKTFMHISEAQMFKDRQVVISGLGEFESAVSFDIGTKASWGYIIYVLKSFYNLEIDTGKATFKKPVEEAIQASDLFFGLINALLQTEPPSFQYYKINAEVLNSEVYSKIKLAAENYISKVTQLNKIFKSEIVLKFIESVENFFNEQKNYVKWIELSENRCALMSMPIEIKELVKTIIHPYNNLSFVDSLDDKILPKFFISRLGLENFELVNVKEPVSLKKSPSRDLFSTLKNTFSSSVHKIKYHCLAEQATQKDYLDILGRSKIQQSVILFPSAMLVKEFYEQNYQELKRKSSLLAQSHSGGSNKLLRNFAINPNSLLLATDKFILKAINSNQQSGQIQKLPVKILILSRLPFEQFSHPYQEAVSKSVENSFMDYALPKALLNFHNLLKFFYTPQLEEIYVFDTKLSKDYATAFREYYKNIPGAEV